MAWEWNVKNNLLVSVSLHTFSLMSWSLNLLPLLCWFSWRLAWAYFQAPLEILLEWYKRYILVKQIPEKSLFCYKSSRLLKELKRRSYWQKSCFCSSAEKKWVVKHLTLPFPSLLGNSSLIWATLCSALCARALWLDYVTGNSGGSQEARGLLSKGVTALYKLQGLTIREEKDIGKVHTLAKKITKNPSSHESKQLQVFWY